MGFIIHRLSHSLALKIILLCCLLTAITALVVGGVSYVRMVGISEEMAVEKLASETRMIALKFAHAYEQMNQDIKVLVYLPPIQGIIRSSNHQGKDHADGSTREHWQRRLQTIFTSMMKERPHYVQMRFIGLENDGLELVRVNRMPEGFEAVTKGNLQKKSGESYFQESLEVGAGKTYISRVSYNREHGEIDSKMVPTIRVITPVFSKENGERFGLLVINIDYRMLIRNTIERIPPGAQAVVSNHKGDYIKRFEGGSVSDFEFSHKYTMPPPYFLEKIKQTQVNEQLFEAGDAKDYFVRVNMYPNNPDAYLAIILHMTENLLLQEAYQVQNYTLLLGMVLLVCSLVASTLMARRLIRPLKDMTRSVTNAQTENKVPILPVGLNDEIGELARAYQQLATKQQEMTQSLSESVERTRAIVDNTVDGMITIDERGMIGNFNKACERIFGYMADEVIGKNVHVLMPEPYHSEHDGYLKNYHDTGEKKIIGIGREVQGKRKDGSIFPIDLSVSAVNVQGRRLYSGIVRDISGRKQAEKDIADATKALQRSNEELERFAYVSSHDLKAPLRAIDQLSNWLQEDLGDALDGENKENMQTLRNRVKRMDYLLDSLLEYSRVGRERDDTDNPIVSGKALLEDIVDLLNPPEGFVIQANPAFDAMLMRRMPLHQVLLNLINNAIKHHDQPHGRIEISLQDKGESYKLAVRDDGPGIAQEFHNKIFDMFQMLRPRDQVEGSGMGLTLVKKLINQLGGSIYVESTPGSGACFYLIWPKNEE